MLGCVVRWFVAEPLTDGLAVPSGDGPGRWIAPTLPQRPEVVVVLAAGGCGEAAGSAVGMVLAAQHDGAAVVCSWSPDERQQEDGEAAAVPLLAVPSARRVARVLQGRGLSAVARGRLVRLGLSQAPVQAAREVSRVTAVGAPVVLVVDGPRDPWLDGVLAEADRVVVAAPPETSSLLVRLALADAARAGRSTAHLVVPASAGRIVGPGGLVLPPALRRAAEAALTGAPCG